MLIRGASCRRGREGRERDARPGTTNIGRGGTQEQGQNTQVKTSPTPCVTLASCSTSLSLVLLLFKLKYSSLQNWGEDSLRFYMCVYKVLSM